jgi:hypothetical protein
VAVETVKVVDHTLDGDVWASHGFLSLLSRFSIIYRRTASPADVVRACLRGFNHDAMTVIPGLRARFLAQGHRFFARTVMARMAGRMLAPKPPGAPPPAQQIMPLLSPPLPSRRVTAQHLSQP